MSLQMAKTSDPLDMAGHLQHGDANMIRAYN